MNHTSLIIGIGLLGLLGAICKKTNTHLEPGVSKSLADSRNASLKKVHYKVHFDIPSSLSEEIEGHIQISFNLLKEDNDLVLDFKNPKEFIHTVKQNNQPVKHHSENEHLIIPSRYLTVGENKFDITFIAGESALNRNDDFLYTLFVPDKASTAFPCFDQPNIKAVYELSLSIPSAWKAIANYPLSETRIEGNQTFYSFEPTLPISSYLFAFATGNFSHISDTINGRKMTLYHRETNSEKVARNAPAIFDLHDKSLEWLKAYTGISYPFKKFDFVLIPAFQFGGMEHPGTIFYKANSLFLPENATLTHEMSRNALIAHETAHMWFGNLVTMEWFNDVWLKEVFANFMADKMVNPNFPQVDHGLRFLQRHHPAAYREDRSLGSHPIQQKLENLNQASLLYGDIIYQKAPIVMKQLEAMMGERNFQVGIRAYLERFTFANATWDDLIEILDKETGLDLSNWSQAWVKEAGMPYYHANLETADGKIAAYQLNLQNKTSGHHAWVQATEVLISRNGKTEKIPLMIEGKSLQLLDLAGQAIPDFILPNASEKAYGYFELDDHSQAFLLRNIHNIEDSFVRSVAWTSLWEGMLRGTISPPILMKTILTALPYENDLLGLAMRLAYMRSIYWGFSDQDQRLNQYASLGKSLWKLMEEEKEKDKKKYFYDAFVAIALQETDVAKLLGLWREELTIPRFNLSEQDFTTLAYELAVRNYSASDSILNAQKGRTANPDRKAAMAFIIPALSSKLSTRDAFFESLHSASNRQKEPWVNTALKYLHHPLRAKGAEKYIWPSLELVEEIQKTGGIFFPKSWVSAVLSGHRSVSALQIVRNFIQDLPPSYPYKLKNKILQAADMLERKASILVRANRE